MWWRYGVAFWGGIMVWWRFGCISNIRLLYELKIYLQSNFCSPNIQARIDKKFIAFHMVYLFFQDYAGLNITPCVKDRLAVLDGYCYKPCTYNFQLFFHYK